MFFDIDDCNGDVFWEDWVEGFVEVMVLWLESWVVFVEGEDCDVVEVFVWMMMLIVVVWNESMFDSMEINVM